MCGMCRVRWGRGSQGREHGEETSSEHETRDVARQKTGAKKEQKTDFRSDRPTPSFLLLSLSLDAHTPHRVCALAACTRPSVPPAATCTLCEKGNPPMRPPFLSMILFDFVCGSHRQVLSLSLSPPRCRHTSHTHMRLSLPSPHCIWKNKLTLLENKTRAPISLQFYYNTAHRTHAPNP